MHRGYLKPDASIELVSSEVATAVSTVVSDKLGQ
jgi:hypothetical protein